jgi:branched-chain amino acid transport system substrate-binding protein
MRVPGEGVEPSRAEAHGILSPARLPIPPSRPEADSVPAARRLPGRSAVRLFAALALAATMLAACTSSRAVQTGRRTVRIAFFQDLSVPEHVDLVSPSFLALDLSIHEREGELPVDVEVVQLDTGGSPDEARALASQVVRDGSYVAAVVAPFWSEPPEVASALAAGGTPTFSLSPQSPSPWAGAPHQGAPVPLAGSPDELWRRLVPDQELQAARLTELIERAAGRDPIDPVCLLGDGSAYSNDLRSLIDGDLPGDVPRELPAPGSSVTTVQDGCSLEVWTGFPDTADAVAAELGDAGLGGARAFDFGADALKTVIPPTSPRGDGVVVGSLTCPCADVTLDRNLAARRFVNLYQSDTGLAPGIYAAEGWDAGQILASALRGGVGDRAGMRSFVSDLQAHEGVSGSFEFDTAGELTHPRVGVFVAEGTRWLPLSA